MYYIAYVLTSGKTMRVLLILFNILFIIVFIIVIACMTILVYSVFLQLKRPISKLYLRRSEESDFCSYDNIPERLIFFILEIEDKTFFSHPGYLIQEIKKVIKLNHNAGRIIAGGSTITQQLVKNLYFRFSHNFFRKIAELLMVIHTEKVLDKKKILELYLNIIYFGNGKYGITDAAGFYFNTDPPHLTENQMLILACLPYAPTTANPLKHPEVFVRVRDKRVARMKFLGNISQEEASRYVSYPASELDPNIRQGDESTESFPDTIVMVNERFGFSSGWPAK